MKKKPTILIVDRNPNVCRYLRRELTKEGCDILVAETCREVLRLARDAQAIDLLIIDPDLPDAGETQLFRTLQRRAPGLRVIIHTFKAVYPLQTAVLKEALFVEKEGDSIEPLKRAVHFLLRT